MISLDRNRPYYTDGTYYVPANPQTFEENIVWGRYLVQQGDRYSSLFELLTFLKWGIYFRYPLCCVAHFIRLRIAGIAPAAYVASNLKNEDEFRRFKASKHIECPKCFNKEKKT